ncbi:hypothetical protein Tsubulata_029081 [Turnera subulata]|uniref:Uncharacterized protein n=1 Tax=Turnera subulata TaxID=218843 RepID=A0A9Q0GKA9_9ROSI|nr:hypothetical protein Tsubulata_029081 [Turnera subulata]
MASSSNLCSSITPLIIGGGEEEDIIEGSVDYEGEPAHRSSSGGWRSAYFIMGTCGSVREIYQYWNMFKPGDILNGALGQSIATAAQNVTTWSGVAALLPILVAFVADSFLGI